MRFRTIFIILVALISRSARSQCPDTLKLLNFPCCISGMDWSEEEQTLYLVSDLNDFIYKAEINFNRNTAAVSDSIKIVDSPHSKGLEAIRKLDNTFYLVYEKDVNTGTTRTAHAFISKGILSENNTLQIENTIKMEDLPDNKGMEGLTFSSDKKSVWVSHESMSRPKSGLDSVRFIQLDLNLNLQQEKWYPIPSKIYFGLNEKAYNDYGITEILIQKDSMYVLERGYGKTSGIAELYINLYKVPLNSLLKSKPLYSFKLTPGPGNCIDNYEGMCYLQAQNKILLISDDNNNRQLQRTILVMLKP